MGVLEVLQKRRSILKYQNQNLLKKKIEIQQIIEAARLDPSAIS